MDFFVLCCNFYAMDLVKWVLCLECLSHVCTVFVMSVSWTRLCGYCVCDVCVMD